MPGSRKPTALLLLVFGGVALGQDQKQPGKIGNTVCLTCHDMQAAYARTAHAAAECESCHGAGSKHADEGGGNIIGFRNGTAREATSQCLSCHGKEAELSAFHRAAHGRSNLSCVSCHQVHPERPSFGLLKSREQELCASCHGASAAQFRKPFRHPVQEGAMKCSDCHNPHNEERRPLRRLAAGAEENCVSCHADKKGPFLFSHAPVELDGCASCHQPHASINPRMLRRSEVSQLCLECHSLTPGVAGGQPPAFHDLRTSRYRNCTSCHREIHGSSSSPAFLK